MKRKSYQSPPTPEQIEYINSDAINALCVEISVVINQSSNDLTPLDIVRVLLWSAQNFICLHEDGDMVKAAKILHSITRKLAKVRWGVTLDGKVEDLVTGEKFSPTRQ
jgi:hypothetical protein